MATQMDAQAQARIRALPGNNVCADCSNLNPQWASVTYGCLVCLECSGHHRSLGVHLSFVRSLAMDSFTAKQISAMEKSGGNAKLIECLSQRGVDKSMSIPAKYNTKQAEYFRNRLARWLEGKTEPPPDPGRYDPATGVSEAQGAEPLPGETTDQYNDRQARLREAARERMRAKFGTSGLGGSQGSLGSPEDEGQGFLGGVGSFLKNNVLDNDKVRGVAGGVAGIAGGGYDALKRAATEGDVGGLIKRNASLEEGSGVRAGLGFIGGVLGGAAEVVGIKRQDRDGGPYVCKKGSGVPDDFFDNFGANEGGDGVSWNDRRDSDQPSMNNGRSVSWNGPSNGYGGGSTPQNAPQSQSWKDDNWGEANVSRVTDDLKKLDVSSTKVAANGAHTNGAVVKPAAAVPSPMAIDLTPVAAQPKKEPVKLQSSDDFFADFGM